MNYMAERKRLLNWLEKQLIGPAPDYDKLLSGSPLQRYTTGILFPIVLGQEGLDPAGEEEDEDDDLPQEAESAGKAAEPAASSRRYVPPSSVGLSFYALGEAVHIEVGCSAARYKKSSERDDSGQFAAHVFERIELGGDALARAFSAPAKRQLSMSKEHIDIFEERAALEVLWRPRGEGWIVTVSLINKQELGDGAEYPARELSSLFEVGLYCRIEQGAISAYPRTEPSLLSEEEQELELQYQERGIYAIGHGAAVDWAFEGDAVRELRTNFLPRVEVPQMTADVAGQNQNALSLAHLGGGGRQDDVFANLEHFIRDYASWVAEKKSLAESFPTEDQGSAQRITERMDKTAERMFEGLCLLRTEPQAAEAFRMANQAMLMQMRQTDVLRGSARDDAAYRWRPFQLAFLLTTIKSAIQDEDAHRDLVDLIWFPTGGGKTEAYLGLIAFCIVWRRLKHPGSGGGTTVLMRYTLRLLTTQQFQRATRMICALELIRRQRPSLCEGEPVSVGLWVGAAASPNRFTEAQDCVRNGKLQRLVLTTCPWCGQAFTAPENYLCGAERFHFRCTNPACDFGKEPDDTLPCNVVDEALYQQPPTLLIATIDKFARLAWEERASVFFGGTQHLPPELVIQDELHLIAGALGSVAGLYEAALDAVLAMRGVHAKYIASTATIRMAQDQVRRLYGRELAVFPPPGLSCDNSYFARTVSLETRPGRLYVGYLAPHLNRQHCMAPLASALLAAPEALFLDDADHEALLDAWWTQVIYHGSLKGVGNSHNAFNIGVREQLGRLLAELKREKEKNDAFSPRDTPVIAQLTSRFSAEENARTFARLEKTRGNEDCLDAVLATNMVSVGLDVARLALMIINGQPLTTAEYIQASSRVGRGEVPGLVFANYYRDQARSLSHYENFRPYHEAFYRFVEPSSVTPYTWQSRTRALHAALVIALRHSGGNLLSNKQAGKFDAASDYVRKVAELLKNRCRQADAERASVTAAHIDQLLREWHFEAHDCQQNRRQLNYESQDRNADCLLYTHEATYQGLWPTLQSMRDVERTALLKLR